MDSRIDRDRLGDLLEIHRLKALYFYNLDHKHWDAWVSLFTMDARLLVDRELEGGEQRIDVTEGIDNILEYVLERLKTIRSVHHGHTPLIDFDSESTARGIWAMQDIIDYGSEGTFYGYGHYRETYRKEAGAWKFSSVHLTRLRTDLVPPIRRG